jgi:hypothetical protein
MFFLLILEAFPRPLRGFLVNGESLFQKLSVKNHLIRHPASIATIEQYPIIHNE